MKISITNIAHTLAFKYLNFPLDMMACWKRQWRDTIRSYHVNCVFNFQVFRPYRSYSSTFLMFININTVTRCTVTNLNDIAVVSPATNDGACCCNTTTWKHHLSINQIAESNNTHRYIMLPYWFCLSLFEFALDKLSISEGLR